MIDEGNRRKLRAIAQKIVEEWKEANGKPLLSPDASRDLVERIAAAFVALEEGRA